MKIKGISLLELLLVIALSAVIMLGALRVFTLLQFKTNIEQLKNNVDLAFILMNDYYVWVPSAGSLPNCLNQTVIQQETFASLLTDATSTSFSSLSSPQLALLKGPQPFNATIDPTTPLFTQLINDSHPPHYNFVLKLRFPPVTSSDQIRSIGVQLNADPYDGSSTLSWTRLPSQSITNSLDNALWVAMAAHNAKLSQYRDPNDPHATPFCPT